MKKTLVLAALIMAIICMLASCSNHTHSFGEWEITKNPTCSTDGEETRYCVCGEAQSKNIPAIAHIVVTDEAVDATCNSTGLTEGKHCSACSEVILAQSEITMLEHTYSGDLDATCEVCGFTREVVCSHEKTSIIPSKDATCTDPGATEGIICDRCETVLQPQTILNPLKHNESDWIVEKIPTETEDGYKYKKCLRCGNKTEEVTISALSDIGLTYEVNSDGETCTVTGIGSFSDTELIIPEYIKGYKVTAIGEKAFENCEMLTKITLPDTTKTIGTRAFYSCTGLTEMTIPASVTSIGTQIFYKASNLTTVYYNSTYSSMDNQFLYLSHITKIVFGGSSVPSQICYNNAYIKEVAVLDSVKYIDSYAFYGCSSLDSVELYGNGVTSIGNRAFYDCTSLTSIVIGNSVTSIGEYAFYNCTSLTSIVIGDSVTSIGEYAFYNCASLTSVVIGNSVSSIGAWTFGYCTSLTSINIPDGVTSIGTSAFHYCSSIASLYIVDLEAWCNISFSSYYSNPMSYGADLYVNGEIVNEISIPDTVVKIKDYTFSGYSNLVSVIIANSVTSIGSAAFMGCSNLTNIVIPDSVANIGSSAFSKCIALTKLEIPDSVINIGERAFYGCYKLVEVINKSGLYITTTSYGLNAIEVHSDESKIVNQNDYLFYTRDGINYLFSYVGSDTELVLPTSYNGANYEIYKCAFYCNDNITSIVIPASVTSIGYDAFYGCSNLISIVIPDSVTSISGGTFEGCTSLTSVIIPASVTSIGQNAFYNCTSLTSVVVPASVTSIGRIAFYNCTSLTIITIPDSVTSIGDSAFYNCFNLTIYCEAESKPGGWNSDWNPGNYLVVWGYKGE